MPSWEEFEAAHIISDKDDGERAIHHTLGVLPEQATPGNRQWMPWKTILSLGAYAASMNSYAALHASNFAVPAVRSTYDGREVQLRGLMGCVTTLSAGQIIMDLGPDLAPLGREIFPSNMGYTGANDIYGRVDVDTDGKIYTEIAIGASGSGFIGLSGIRWSTI